MSLFDDFSRFLETRLDEFLRANPHLELQAIEEQLRGQEEDAIALLIDFKRREKQLEEDILSTAQEIQSWHQRIEKAKAANRLDLVEPAQAREAALLRQGNHLWGQTKGVKSRIEQTTALRKKLQDRRQEVKTKIAQAQATRSTPKMDWSTTGWNQSPYDLHSRTVDPLDETFKRWEAEEELADLKRKMGQ